MTFRRSSSTGGTLLWRKRRRVMCVASAVIPGMAPTKFGIGMAGLPSVAVAGGRVFFFFKVFGPENMEENPYSPPFFRAREGGQRGGEAQADPALHGHEAMPA